MFLSLAESESDRVELPTYSFCGPPVFIFIFLIIPSIYIHNILSLIYRYINQQKIYNEHTYIQVIKNFENAQPK